MSDTQTTQPALPPPPQQQQQQSKDIPVNFWFKNRLQEYTQKLGLLLPVYHTVSEGANSERKYRCTVLVDGKSYTTMKTFPTRKSAEQEAARLALASVAEKDKEDCNVCYENLKSECTIFCKSILLEYAMKMKLEKPTYATTQAEGPLLGFVSSVTFNGVTYPGPSCKSKKEAEQLAARSVIFSLLDSESRIVVSEIVKAKMKLQAALNEAKDTDSIHSAVIHDGASLVGDVSAHRKKRRAAELIGSKPHHPDSVSGVHPENVLTDRMNVRTEAKVTGSMSSAISTSVLGTGYERPPDIQDADQLPPMVIKPEPGAKNSAPSTSVLGTGYERPPDIQGADQWPPMFMEPELGFKKSAPSTSVLGTGYERPPDIQDADQSPLMFMKPEPVAKNSAPSSSVLGTGYERPPDIQAAHQPPPMFMKPEPGAKNSAPSTSVLGTGYERPPDIQDADQSPPMFMKPEPGAKNSAPSTSVLGTGYEQPPDIQAAHQPPPMFIKPNPGPSSEDAPSSIVFVSPALEESLPCSTPPKKRTKKNEEAENEEADRQALQKLLPSAPVSPPVV